RARDRDGARKRLQEALKIGQRIDPKGDGAFVVAGSVAKARAEMGDLREARGIIDAIPRELWRAVALVDLAAAWASAGDIKAAVEAAESIEEEYRKGEALKGVVVAQLRAGDLKGAEKTAVGIDSAFWRVEVLAEFARAHAKAGDRAAVAAALQKAREAAGEE